MRTLLMIGVGLILTQAPAVLAQEVPDLKGSKIPVPKEGRKVPKEPKSTGKKVTIKCKGQAFFDNVEGIVIFEKDVVVSHPSFEITCEELELFLKDNPTGGAADPMAATEGGIERANAKGKGQLVQIVRFTPKGLIRAVCGRAVYDSKTGDISLHDFPQVQRGNESIQATEKKTVIYLRSNGNFDADGPIITTLPKQKDKKPKKGKK